MHPHLDTTSTTTLAGEGDYYLYKTDQWIQ